MRGVPLKPIRDTEALEGTWWILVWSLRLLPVLRGPASVFARPDFFAGPCVPVWFLVPRVIDFCVPPFSPPVLSPRSHGELLLPLHDFLCPDDFSLCVRGFAPPIWLNRGEQIRDTEA